MESESFPSFQIPQEQINWLILFKLQENAKPDFLLNLAGPTIPEGMMPDLRSHTL
jgi:hypothetical protein